MRPGPGSQVAQGLKGIVMATQYVRRGTGLAANQANKGTANPIFVDSDTNELVFGAASSGS